MSADDRLEKVPEVVSALRSISTGHALSNDLCMDVGWRRVCSLGADLLERVGALEARMARLQAENEELLTQHRTEYCEATGYDCVELGRLRAALSRVEAERDAAMADLELTAACRTCGKNRGFGRCDSKGGTCKYQWRGAQGEG